MFFRVVGPAKRGVGSTADTVRADRDFVASTRDGVLVLVRGVAASAAPAGGKRRARERENIPSIIGRIVAAVTVDGAGSLLKSPHPSNGSSGRRALEFPFEPCREPTL